MAKQWDEFFPLLAPHLPGCPDETMRTYLASTTADFLARSYVWRQPLESIALVPDQQSYFVDFIDGLVEKVLLAHIDGLQLKPLDPEYLPVDWLTAKGAKPTHYWVVSDDEIFFYPTPTEASTVQLRGAVKTARDAFDVDDWIYEVWADAIVSGTIARICTIPNKEWSNPQMAEYHAKKFERAVSSARIRSSRNGGKSVHSSPFA